MIIAISLFLLLSACSLFEDKKPFSGSNVRTYDYRTERFLSPLAPTSSLYQLYSVEGEPISIKRGDTLRIRFFDQGAKSHEAKIAVGGRLNTIQHLFNAMEQAALDAGVQLQLSIANPQTGELQAVVLSDKPITNLSVENLSHPLTNVKMKEPFWWMGSIHQNPVTPQTTLRSYAQEQTPLLALLTESGNPTNLQIGAIISCRGAIDGQTIEESQWQFAIRSGDETLRDLINFLNSFGREFSQSSDNLRFRLFPPEIEAITGAIGMRHKRDYRESDDFIIFATNPAKDSPIPGNFNRSMELIRISDRYPWDDDHEGF